MLFSVGKEKIQAKLMGVGCFASVLSTLLLVSLLGVQGAAYATVFTECLMAVAITRELWKLKFHYRADSCLIRLSFAALVMVLVVNILLGLNFILAIIGGAISYLGMLFLIRVFDSEDMLYIKSLLRRGKENRLYA